MTQVHVLAQSKGAGTAHTGTTAETVIKTVTIKGGTLTKDGRLKVDAYLAVTNSANDKTIKVRLGGIAGDVLFSKLVTTVDLVDFSLQIANRGAANSQVAWVTGVAAATADIDTSDDQDLVITATLETDSESITLEDFVVTMVEPTP